LSNAVIPELLKVPDFLELYSVSRTEFYRQVAAGKIRLRKMGRATRIARTDAESWAAGLPEVTN